jgi:hypothetical protein
MRVYFAASYTAYCEPTAGLTTWAIDFEDGYIDKEYVKAKSRSSGKWDEVRIASVVGNTVTLARGLRPCDTLLIYRDTPKEHPLTVYGYGGSILADESREVATRQAMHVIVELTDAGKLQHEDCICGCAI